MSEIIKDRMEILFLYETKDCNPNGDPLDENKPRTDPETGVATVTDVRIKRTVRDYLHQARGLDLLVRDTYFPDGTLKDGKGRADDFVKLVEIQKENTITQVVDKVSSVITDRCIDARLFGATLPIHHGKKDSSIQITGPVQFNGFNRSLHRVAPVVVQGTAAFASKPGATQKSFREDHILPYACISVYGVVNELAARASRLTEEDVNFLLEGLWKGTESLISRSKMGHHPLLLLRIRYRNGYRIGDLAGRITLESELDDTAIRSVADYRINVTPLVDVLTAAAEHIAAVDWKQDRRLVLVDGESSGLFGKLDRVSKMNPRPLEL
jgi:CRISPR-associated protein Csh2